MCQARKCFLQNIKKVHSSPTGTTNKKMGAIIFRFVNKLSFLLLVILPIWEAPSCLSCLWTTKSTYSNSNARHKKCRSGAAADPCHKWAKKKIK